MKGIAGGIDEAVPAIAVVMPVFNRASVVRRAIDSVLAQDFRACELIVVNDGITPAVGTITHLTGRVLDSHGQSVVHGGAVAGRAGLRAARRACFCMVAGRLRGAGPPGRHCVGQHLARRHALGERRVVDRDGDRSPDEQPDLLIEPAPGGSAAGRTNVR